MSEGDQEMSQVEEIKVEKNEGDDDKKSYRLFVGKLNIITNEHTLKRYFSDFGEVEDCFIMRFPDTKKSKCFGFLNFKTEKALNDALDGEHVVDDNKLEVRKAVPRGESEAEVFKKERAKYQDSKMYVGDLTEDTNAEDLKEYFSTFGTVVDSFIMRDGYTGKSKKFGFVSFETTEMMEKCIEAKPHTINEKEVELRRAAPKKGAFGKRKFEDDDDDIIEGEHVELRRLYVGSIPTSVPEDEIQEYFEKYGKVIECTLQKNKSTGKSKGMAFITFAEAKTVNDIQAEKAHKIGGKTIECRRPAPRGCSPRDPEVLAVTNKLWVGGFCETVGEKEVKEYFEKFGTVEDVEALMTPDNRMRGFGFVTFESSDTVDKVVLMARHFIGERRMDVKKGLDKREMAAIKRQREAEFMEAQYRMGGMNAGSGGFGRGAKAPRMVGNFGRGGMHGGDRKTEILSKIDAIYDNIAELNQLTNDPSIADKLMGMRGGSGGGGWGAMRSGGGGWGASRPMGGARAGGYTNFSRK